MQQIGVECLKPLSIYSSPGIFLLYCFIRFVRGDCITLQEWFGPLGAFQCPAPLTMRMADRGGTGSCSTTAVRLDAVLARLRK
jgi:hypothetical protein